LVAVAVAHLLLVKQVMQMPQEVMVALERPHLLLEHLLLTLEAVVVLVNKDMAQVQKQGAQGVQVAAVQVVLAELILQLPLEHQELQILEAVEVEVLQTDLIRQSTDTEAATAALAL
jgi:hypothetical protein